MAWVPSLGVTSGLLAYAVVAIVMVVAEVYLLYQLVPRRGGPPTLSRMTIGASALLGSAAVLLGLLNMLFFPSSLDAATEFLWALNFMMFAPPGLWVIAVIVFRDRRIDPTAWRWPALLAGAATSAEVLMGLLFSVSSPVPVLDPTTVAASLTSPWYLWSMAGAMAALILWVPIERTHRGALLILAGEGFLAAWIPSDPVGGSVLMGVGMMAGLAYLFVGGAGFSVAATLERRFWTAYVGAFGAMGVTGWWAASAPGVVALFAFGATMTVVMTVELAVVVRHGLRPDPGAGLWRPTFRTGRDSPTPPTPVSGAGPLGFPVRVLPVEAVSRPGVDADPK